MWCTDGREMMRRQTVRNNVFLLVSLARMWMTGMHIIIITVPAVAGGNARCWCRRCHYQRVMMKCTALQGSLSVGRNGILLTISGGIIPIRISGAFMMRSVSLNTLIMLFAASLPRHWSILWRNVVLWCLSPMRCLLSRMPMWWCSVIVTRFVSLSMTVLRAGRFRLFMRRDTCLMPRWYSRMYGISGKHASIVISKKTGRK